jgi:molybdenum cofactor synthesis domain-containing protein
MQRRDLRRKFKLTTLEKALSQLGEVKHFEPLGPEEISIEKSTGRVLAVDVISKINIPKENKAVFDGYAICSTDTLGVSKENPVMLKIVSKTFPGEVASKLSSGQTVFTACGAPMPRGADAALMAENVRLIGDEIEVRFSVNPGENVALVGEDVKKGRLLLKARHLLRPQDVGLLAELGMRSIKVFKKPKVGIISVGDELVKLSEKESDKIVNNYALIVSGLVLEFGAIPQLFGIIPDNLDQIKKTISEALEKTHIVTTISGCSVGPKDLVPDAINALEKSGLVFQGVKLSPGKVMGAGIVKGKPVVMLPGHIVSTYAGFFHIVTPLIAQYSGLGKTYPLTAVKARITQDVKAKPTKGFLRVRLTTINGEFEAEPVHRGASVLTSLVDSNGYTIVPLGKGLQKGTYVKVILYGRYEFAHMTNSL